MRDDREREKLRHQSAPRPEPQELLRDRFGRDPFAGATEAELRAADAAGMTDPFAGMTGAQPGAQPGPAPYTQPDARPDAHPGAAYAGQLSGAAAGYPKNGPIPQPDRNADPFAAARPVGGGRIPAPQPIGREQVLKAGEILRRYQDGKRALEQRIVENERWYRRRHWEVLPDKKREVQPASAWLFNAIASKHADAMDNFPQPNVLPREEGDREEAESLTAILPVILAMNDFEQTYNDVWTYKLIHGTGVYGVVWDGRALGGVGDVSIFKADLLNLFWEPGCADIQRSPNLFHLQLADNDRLISQYPALKGKLGGQTEQIAKYIGDDNVDTTSKSVVVDWYYKRDTDAGEVLHYCKYVGDTVLYASENDAEYRERGYYDHGMYPFVFDTLFPVEGSPAGFGYVDVGKNAQQYIDRLSQAILENALANARPRHFISMTGSVNEAEYADITQDFVHVDGQLGQDSIVPIEGKSLPSVYLQVLRDKIDELKETTGNRDVNNGGTASGATAASAIAAMQEAGGKLSRDHAKSAYRAYKRLILMVIELVRQFYTVPRRFRITGRQGEERFVSYDNAKLQPQETQAQGIDEPLQRMPLFDLEISAQKASPYSRMSQNEMALQFYNAGFFAPQNADAALSCLKMMDFDRRQFVMDEIRQTGTLYQQVQALQAQLDELQAALGMRPAPSPALTGGDAPPGGAVKTQALGGEIGESPVTRKAREAAAARTSPT